MLSTPFRVLMLLCGLGLACPEAPARILPVWGSLATPDRPGAPVADGSYTLRFTILNGPAGEIPVTGEAHSFQPPFMLSRRPILPESLVLSAADGSIAYRQGTDYTVDAGGRISRTPDSTIVNTTPVRASYRWTATTVWTETQQGVAVRDGLFTALLGRQSPVPADRLTGIEDLRVEAQQGAVWREVSRGPLTPMPVSTAPRVAPAAVKADFARAVGERDGNRTASGADSAAPFVGGGWLNAADGPASVVGGGEQNRAAGDTSVVAGGYGNVAGNHYDAIGGGYANVASGRYSFIGGGFGNSARGEHATVPGGIRNSADGFASLAAGHHANARHSGSFVWSDSGTADFASTAVNQFLISATGGVGIGTTRPSRELEINAPGDVEIGLKSTDEGSHLWTLQSSGVTRHPGWDASFQIIDRTLDMARVVIDTSGNVGIGTDAPGYRLHVNGSVAGVGAFRELSDGRLKRDVQPIDDAMETVKKLQGVSFAWRRDENPESGLPGGRQVGFVAQDVQRVLPEAVSHDGRGLYSVSSGSVVPLMVEALKQQQATIERQQRELDDISARLKALEERRSQPARP